MEDPGLPNWPKLYSEPKEWGLSWLLYVNPTYSREMFLKYSITD